MDENIVGFVMQTNRRVNTSQTSDSLLEEVRVYVINKCLDVPL